ncbi:hypothetical protein CDAR_243161 [Caerostris darwini]|uniref:Secreted protein n=1 Tax=Caerostris darwini TaxID=1538125 RepID=A0AAV4ML98_9ARAC|nr:hypothetical protein CDAR_243161 [Caerostris darwini]
MSALFTSGKRGLSRFYVCSRVRRLTNVYRILGVISSCSVLATEGTDSSYRLRQQQNIAATGQKPVIASQFSLFLSSSGPRLTDSDVFFSKVVLQEKGEKGRSCHQSNGIGKWVSLNRIFRVFFRARSRDGPREGGNWTEGKPPETMNSCF